MKDDSKKSSLNRRMFLKGVGIASATIAAPHIWVPSAAYAQQTEARGAVKHLIYIRLSGGFRFTTAFNSEVASRYNPFGKSASKADGAEWGPSALMGRAPFLEGEDGAALRELGMKSVTDIADDIAVIPCVDHEPLAGSADGNHISGLQRFVSGYASNGTGIFTMINYGLRDRKPDIEDGVVLPAFVLGGSGMSNGTGRFAGYRPPVLRDGFSGFGFNAEKSLPRWARAISSKMDVKYLSKVHTESRGAVDAYLQSREAAKRYAEILNDPILDVRAGGDEPFDGLSNSQLQMILGDSGPARNLILGLRLFHFGCPAIYLNQGGYDMHSGEEEGLPPRMDALNRLISGLHVALKTMIHPAGGTYWDHTLIVMGSEFGRTARGGRFNSARGSDHNGDNATRWMSMPVMGGVISQAGNGGRSFGGTTSEDLAPLGKVYSYRSLMKTLMDLLGADHSEFFPADAPFGDLTR